MVRLSNSRSRCGRLPTITEEEIAEYMVKKAQKKAVSVAKKLKLRAVSGYSNDSNPFGDSNLNEKFVWRKKIERDVSQGVSLEEFSMKAEKKRERERMAEIEKAKRRRETSAIQKARQEEEISRLARERDQAQFKDWEKKEEEFQYDQHKIRSEIRLREGRPKPIDLLSQHIIDPLMVFNDLSVEEIEELHVDIKMSLDLDRAKPNPTERKYWEALLVVCEWKLSEAMKSVDFEERGFHASTEGDVMSFLQGKGHGELESFQSQIESKMQSGTALVVEYWEVVLKRLHVCKAKAFLNENHSKKPEISQSLDENNNKDDNFEENDSVIVSNDEIYLESRHEYRLHKPKYFNRVHVGYEWNKYNQTHYDHDNPPPKTVKGYKFDVFYPNLVNKSKTPTYNIEKDGDSTETCIIRFHGGPPYEDLAFRIANKEWETSSKNGFKCNFENGVLRLYFNFVRYAYHR